MNASIMETTSNFEHNTRKQCLDVPLGTAGSFLRKQKLFQSPKHYLEGVVP